MIEPDIHPAFSDDHPVWQRAWKAIVQWGGRKDIDYFAGRRVPGQLEDHGLEILSVRGETPFFRGGAGSEAARDLYKQTIELILADVIRSGFLSNAEGEDILELMNNPHVWLMSFCFVATYARKPL